LFWEHRSKSSENADCASAHPLQVTVIIALLACSPLLVILGGPISEYMLNAATQLHDLSGGINAVLKGGM